MGNLPDIILPLGVESKRENLELKLALRSLEKNCSGTYGQIYVATERLPEWLVGVTHVPATDDLPHNKDGNIITKIVKTLEAHPQIDRFIFLSDDQAVVRPCDLSGLRPIYNCRGKRAFLGGNRWQKRVLRTFEFLEARGVVLAHNYESHTPQLHDRGILKALEGVDYREGNGYVINTLFYGLRGVTGGVLQDEVNVTYDKASDAGRPLDRTFVGYNDEGFLNGLSQRLLAMFPMPSRYER